MDTKTVKKPLTKFTRRIPKSVKVDKVIIFGSYLEGDPTEDSDLDVLVISDSFKDLNEDQRLSLLYDARTFDEPIVHPWGFTNEELEKASPLTTLGYARDHGYRFI